MGHTWEQVADAERAPPLEVTLPVTGPGKGERVYERRELYPAPPVVLVAAEIRFGHEPYLSREGAIDALLGSLRSHFPLLAREEVQALTLGPNTADQRRQTNWRALAESRMESVTITSEALVIETTDYAGGFEDFTEIVRQACDAAESCLHDARIWRIGLRYIDEFSIPGVVKTHADWAAWLSPHLTAATQMAQSDAIRGFHGDAGWVTGDETGVTVRWGTFDEPTILAPNLPLSRRSPAIRGPIFVLDIDSFWEPAIPPRFTSQRATDWIQELHKPTGEIFQGALTDALRKRFRKVEE